MNEKRDERINRENQKSKCRHLRQKIVREQIDSKIKSNSKNNSSSNSNQEGTSKREKFAGFVREVKR